MGTEEQIVKDKRSPNKTTLFLVPTLGFLIKELKSLGFINGYSYMEDRSHKDCIYLLFDVKDQVRLGEFVEKNREKIIDEIDYENNYTVLVCPFPVKFIPDKDKFWKGSYSKFSKNYRELLNENERDYKFQISVIQRSDIIREGVEKRIGSLLPYNSEVASVPEESWETLDIQLFINEEL